MAGLNKTLGLPMLVFYGTGMILGAGIYSVIGKAAEPAGGTLWMSFLIAAIATVITALSYAELGTRFPKAGAEYIYLTEAFKTRKWMGSTIGIAVAFSGAATAATVALAFSGYLAQLTDISSFLIPIALLMAFTGLAVVGIRESAWANVLFTLIEAGGLILIIYLGFTSDKLSSGFELTPTLGTLTGAALVVFSFFGFENIVNLAEESKEPIRDIPRAILICLGISTVLYVLVSIAAMSLVDAKALGESSAPLMTVASSVSKNFGVILGSVALFSTANTALISMIGASRIIYGMAEAKSLPGLVTRILPKRKTPWVASVIILVVSLALLPLGEVDIVASISSLATMLAFIGVNAALISIRWHDPTGKSSFRVPLSIGRVPILPIVGIFTSLVFLTQFNLTVYLVGGVFLALTAVIFLIKKQR